MKTYELTFTFTLEEWDMISSALLTTAQIVEERPPKEEWRKKHRELLGTDFPTPERARGLADRIETQLEKYFGP